MYKPGELEVRTAPNYEGEEVYDSDSQWPWTSYPVVMLGHRCDLWVIGGPEQVRAMIADLNNSLRLMEEARDDE